MNSPSLLLALVDLGGEICEDTVGERACALVDELKEALVAIVLELVVELLVYRYIYIDIYMCVCLNEPKRVEG